MSDTIVYVVELALHHLWQGTVLAGCTWIALRWCRQLSAESRYWIWYAALLLIAVLPLLALLPLPHVEAVGEQIRVISPPVLSSPVVPISRHDTIVASIVASQGAAFDWGWALFLLPGAWAACVTWRVLALARSARTLSTWRRAATPVPGNDLPLSAGELGACEVRESANVSVPMVIGFLRPCILLPRGLIARTARSHLALVLRHEIAHARRRDTWLALVQRIVQAVYFYNPVVAWVSRQVERERECSCDDRAIRMAGETGVDYADCLVHVTRAAALSKATVLAVGAAGNTSQLRLRVDRLLNRSDLEDTNMSLRYVLGSAVFLTALAALLSVSSPRAVAANTTPGHAVQSRTSGSAALGRALVEVAAEGNLDEARALISAGADVNYALDGDGTPLILAAKRGELELLEFFIERGADINKFSSGDGNPLISASAAGHRQIVSALVERGADVNAHDASDESPLINAARSGHLPIVDYLLDHGADINLVVEAGTIDGTEFRSPLSEARKHGHDAVVRRLLQRGATR